LSVLGATKRSISWPHWITATSGQMTSVARPYSPPRASPATAPGAREGPASQQSTAAAAQGTPAAHGPAPADGPAAAAALPDGPAPGTYPWSQGWQFPLPSTCHQHGICGFCRSLSFSRRPAAQQGDRGAGAWVPLVDPDNGLREHRCAAGQSLCVSTCARRPARGRGTAAAGRPAVAGRRRARARAVAAAVSGAERGGGLWRGRSRSRAGRRAGLRGVRAPRRRARQRQARPRGAGGARARRGRAGAGDRRQARHAVGAVRDDDGDCLQRGRLTQKSTACMPGV